MSIHRVCVLLLLSTALVFAQNNGGRGGNNLIQPLADLQKELKGKLERITVHGKSLEGNLEGDSADRDVFVYLPPSYQSDPGRRYPVVYTLHGYGLRAQQWVGFANVGGLERGLATGTTKEMILVSPDAFSLHNGSFYSNSKTTGDWETFIAVELVSYIDSHYRTIPNRMSRGLTGHSMGGAGTLFLGAKHANLWAAIAPVAPASFMMNNNRAEILGKVKAAGVPVLLITGDADEVVAPANTRMWAETLKELNVNHVYIEQPGITHGPVITSSQKEIYDFFAKQVKQ